MYSCLFVCSTASTLHCKSTAVIIQHNFHIIYGIRLHWGKQCNELNCYKIASQMNLDIFKLSGAIGSLSLRQAWKCRFSIIHLLLWIRWRLVKKKKSFQTKAKDKLKEIIKLMCSMWFSLYSMCESKHVHQGLSLCISFLYFVYVNGCIRTKIRVNLF